LRVPDFGAQSARSILQARVKGETLWSLEDLEITGAFKNEREQLS
jgi:predicted DNA-binding helix-hairpin-helix protein